MLEAMWLMLQQDQPDDYVIGTGETHSVKEFMAEAFGYVGLDWRKYVEFDPKYVRPTEVDTLLADAPRQENNCHGNPNLAFQNSSASW